MSRQAEIFASSIVCVGSFNPPILTPGWLERHKLIGSQDAEAARSSKPLLITNEVAQFETDWFSLQVLGNQFALNSKGAVTEAFKDLMFGILTILPQTPITAIGLNFMAHYKLANLTDYNAIGDALAPKPIWRELFPGVDAHPGLIDLAIRIQTVDPKTQIAKSKSHTNVTVQPSQLVPRGVFILCNDHHDLSEGKEVETLPAMRAAALVDECWESARQDALRVMEGLVDKALVSVSSASTQAR